MNFNQLDNTIETKQEHEAKVNNRKYTQRNGVKELYSLDSEELLMERTMVYIIVRGNNLQLQNLNVEDGIVHISGKVYELTYIDEQREEKAKSLFSKLFR